MRIQNEVRDAVLAKMGTLKKVDAKGVIAQIKSKLKVKK